MGCLLRLILVALLISCASASSSCPQFYNPNTQLYYDISPLSLNVADWYEETSVGDFYFNFCTPINHECHPVIAQSVCEYKGPTVLSSYGCGDTSSMNLSPLGLNDGLVVTYTTESSQCNSGGVTTRIEVSCDPLGRLGVIGDIVFTPALCQYTIEFKSLCGCGTDGISPHSPTPVVSPSSVPSYSPPPVNPNNPKLPGTSTIGNAFNILESSTLNPFPIVGKGLETNVFSPFTYMQNKTWQVEDYIFDVPDQVSIAKAQSFGVKTFSYQSVAEYMDQVSKDFGLSLDVAFHHIPIGGSAYFTNLNQQMTNAGSVLSVALENIPLYNMRLFPNLTLSDDFVSRVQSLNSSNYEEFFTDYGTHVQTGIDLGGIAGLFGVVYGSQSNYQSSTSIQVSAHIAFLQSRNHTILPFDGINKSTPPSFQDSYHYSRIGGITSISSYTEWVQSVPKDPSVIGRNLIPITFFMKQVSNSISDDYEKWLESTYDQYEVDINESASSPPPLMYSTKSCTTGQGALIGISFYFDDDDDCQSNAWQVYSTDSSATSMACKIPSGVSWATSGIFGPTPCDNDFEAETIQSPQRKLRTTSIEQGNYQCGLYPCIPGLDSLGMGIDITTGTSKLPSMRWTFEEGNFWHSPFTGKTYAYPDQVVLSTNSASSDKQTVYNSFSSYLTNNTESTASGWDGFFFQFGKEEQSIRGSFDKAESILAIAEEFYISHSMEIENISVSNALSYAISNLPVNYDQEIYYNFLAYWGTHYTDFASYGGKAKLFSFVDQEYFMSYSEEEIQRNIGIQYDNWKVGMGWGNSEKDSTYTFSTESFQWVSFYGGDASLALTNQWNEWINSTHFSPAQITKNLVPIYELAADSTIQENIITAISNYYDAANLVPMPPPVYIGMTLTHGSHYSPASFVFDFDNYCTWTHGFAWTEYSHFATSVDQQNYYFDVPVGFYAPSIVSKEVSVKIPTSSGYNSCPSQSFISNVGTVLDIGCSTECTNSFGTNTLFLGNSFTCSELYVE